MLKYSKLIKIVNAFYKKALQLLPQQLNILKRNLSLFSNQIISEEECLEWFAKNKANENVIFDILKDFDRIDDDFQSKNGLVVVSLLNEDPDTLKVQQSYFLSKTKNIPDLWVFKGKEIYINQSLSNISKDSAKYSFILHSLPALINQEEVVEKDFFNTGSNITSYDVELFNKFINKNKLKIDSLLNFCKQYPKQIGSGTDAIAFDIGSGFILKLFSSDVLYNDYKSKLNKLYENKKLSETDMMIYDVSTLGSINGINIYYVITEKMKPIASENSDVKTYITNINIAISQQLSDNKDELLFLKKMLKNKKNLNKIVKRVKNYAEVLARRCTLEIENDYDLQSSVHAFEDLTERYRLRDNWLESYIEEIIIKVISGNGDLHYGNLGVTQYGNLRFFDSFHPNWIDKLNMSGWQGSINDKQIKEDEEDFDI